MGNSIKRAQEAMYDCIKKLPFGEILLTLAPIFVITMAISTIISVLGIGSSQALNDFFRIIYYVYMLAMVACFASNKMTLMIGIMGLRSVANIVYVIRSGIYANAVINFIGYAFLAYLFYYIYKQRNSAE